MRKKVVLAACVALPFVTAFVADKVTPGYVMAGHTATLLIAIIAGFAGLLAFGLNMRDEGEGVEGWEVATGWTLAVAILIVTLMETVILKPGGVDGRQWLPILALAALAVVAGCQREGQPVTRDALVTTSILTALVTGGVLALSLCVSAAAARLSGDDMVTLTLAAVLAAPLFGALLQTRRADYRSRAMLAAGCAAFVMFLVVTSSGTYEWTPHYGSRAPGQGIFE